MADVTFENFSIQVKNAMEEEIIAYLHEAAGEIEALTKSNTRPLWIDSGIDLKNSWEYKVDEADKKATVGSPLEASYWEEFGTGSHALYNNGRKGWWVYVKGNNTPRSNQKYYTEDEAKSVAAGLRSKGLDAYATNGIDPNRPLHHAYETLKNPLIRRAEEVLKGRLNE